MYMAVCYHGVGGRNWGLPPNANSTSQQSTAVLMDWHQQDPPSAMEVARHELIFAQQKNRNPFIDHRSSGMGRLH
jgi:endonuclease I